MLHVALEQRLDSTRHSGLSAVGDVSWGTHVCQFYRSREDLIETLVPFFRAGLADNEACLWITSEPFLAADAVDVLRAAVPDVDERIERGQIEIVDHRDWYERAGGLGVDDVLAGWLDREASALARGYDGLRISGNTFWLERDDWESFAAYEASVHRAFHGRHILALCSYSLDRCDAEQIIEVVRNHAFALVRREGRWDAIQSATMVLMAVEPERHAPAVGSGHSVRFFDQREYPADRVATHVAAALTSGGASAVFATSDHLAAISTVLGGMSIDVESEIDHGRLVIGDADDIARQLTRDGPASRSVFDALIGQPVLDLLSRHVNVRGYGEVVDVLSRIGDIPNALQIESWWNELIDGRPLNLLCGYALDSFADAARVPVFRTVCSEHLEVEPLEPRIRRGSYGQLIAELQQVDAALERETSRRHSLETQWDQLRAAEETSRLSAQSASERLASLQRVTAMLSELSTAAEIAAVVCSDIAQVTGARHALLAEPAEDGAGLRLIGDELAQFSIDDSHPLTQAFRTGRPRWVTAPLLLPGWEQVSSAVCLPVALGGRRLGALALAFDGPCDQGAPADRALLDDYAKQIAIALDRARSYEDIQRARQRLQLIVDAAGGIAKAKLDLQHVLDAVVREVTAASFADGCVISLQRTIHDTPVQIAAGIACTVAGSTITVPLRASGEVLGTLTASRRPGVAPLDADDRQLLQDLADRAGLSVENALLYQRAQRERERAEQERCRAEQERRRAELASRAKDEFLAMLGHELRNPLSPILTAVQLMHLRAGDMLAKERTIIERQVNHMVRLVDDLLDVSRIARGKVELKCSRVELAQIVADAIEIASPLLEERSHKLVVSIRPSGLLVDVDAARVAQVIVNLLTNAAKYTPPRGLVTVATAVRDDHVYLSVIDNGVGIEPEFLPHIFDVFVQGDQAIDRAQGGLGLGLAIARNLVEMHGGTLSVASAGRACGSEFTLALPMVKGIAHPPEAPLARAADAARRSLNLLVVDDNVDAAHVLSDALTLIGHNVRIAHDGPTALDAIADFRPDLALVDIGLPVMDGYELAQRLRGALGSVCPKLIAVTGYGQRRDRNRSRAAGFDEHAVKPVDLEKLQVVINKLCG